MSDDQIASTSDIALGLWFVSLTANLEDNDI